MAEEPKQVAAGSGEKVVVVQQHPPQEGGETG